IHATPDVVARVAQKLRNGSPAGGRKKDNSMQNILLHPTGPETRLVRINCPTGKASAMTARAFLSASVLGPEPGWVRFWFQDDDSGISNYEAPIGFNDGRSERKWC